MILREKHNASYDLASSFRVQTRGALGCTAGHGVRMSPSFALLESVAVALPRALWH